MAGVAESETARMERRPLTMKTERPDSSHAEGKKARRWIWSLTVGIPVLLLAGLLIIWASFH